MNYLSICSGIEAATVAWHHMGWRPAGFAEIEKFPAQVLAHHYPNVRNYGDLTKHDTWGIEAGSVDLLVGGTPCQAFSVAGLRRGMDDARGQLTLEFVRLAARLRPRWIVWENVPGVLSSGGGRDFGSFLGALAQLGYGYAYRVLDAQYFGVAQRRRRVFAVGYLGDWRRAAAVLFERESVRGNPPPRRETGQEVAPCLDVRAERSGETTFATSGGLVKVAGSLGSRAKSGGGFGTKQDLEDQHALGGAGCFVPASPISFHNRQDPDVSDGVTHSLGAKDNGLGVAMAFSAKDYGADAGNIAPTLRAMGHGASHANGGGQLAVVQPVAFKESQSGCRLGLVHATLDANKGSRRIEGVMMAMAVASVEVADTLGVGANQTSGFQSEVAAAGMQVRRLTPVECERLQGFPDGYTDIRPRGKDTPDGPRYKALGNSMAVPVMRWIGERIDIVDKL